MSATQPSLAPRVVSRPELSVECQWFFQHFGTSTGSCACNVTSSGVDIAYRESLGRSWKSKIHGT